MHVDFLFTNFVLQDGNVSMIRAACRAEKLISPLYNIYNWFPQLDERGQLQNLQLVLEGNRILSIVWMMSPMMCYSP